MKKLICFLAGGFITIAIKFIFSMFGFNPDGFYSGFFSCFFIFLFALWVVYKEAEEDFKKMTMEIKEVDEVDDER